MGNPLGAWTSIQRLITILNMINRLRRAVVPVVLVSSIAGSACGSDSNASDDEAPETTAGPATATSDDDHGGEEGHDGDDEDQDDEDHDDEDHDDHDDESGGLGAHEHGTAELSVAWIDAQVAIDLVSPTFNVFGFEYEPTSDDDLAIEADRTEVLTGPGMVAVNDDARCAMIDPVSTEVERDGTHSEITVSWVFECENADAVSEVDFSGLFAEFSNFEDIDVQWISDTQQSSAELSPSSATVSLDR